MESLVVGAWGVVILVACGSVVWMTMVMVDVVFGIMSRRSLRTDLINALKKGSPSWSQVCTMADTRHVNMSSTEFLIKTLIRDVVANRLTGLDDKVSVLEALQEEHQKQLPFEGLPTQTRFMMDRLRLHLGPNGSDLYPLANHVRDLLKHQEPANRRQRFYTFGGFVVGIAGIAFGAFTFIFPPAAAPASAACPAPPAVSVPKDGPKQHP